MQDTISKLLEDIQGKIYDIALNRQKSLTTHVNNFNEFKDVLQKDRGFIIAHWDGTSETELKIKNETGATIRCIPLTNETKEKWIMRFFRQRLRAKSNF